jgi:hypothetical protein
MHVKLPLIDDFRPALLSMQGFCLEYRLLSGKMHEATGHSYPIPIGSGNHPQKRTLHYNNSQ